MKSYEFLYIVSIFLIIVSIAMFKLSSTIIADTENNSVTSLLGKTTEIDTNFTAEEMLSEVRAKERQGNLIYLWTGIPLGIIVFITGLLIKRKKEGPDSFIDDEIENEEEIDTLFF